MKKVYNKPDIVFDDFTLTNTIAASCEKYNSSPSLNQCGYVNEGGYRVFYSGGMSGCEDVWRFPYYNGITYDVFVFVNGLFNSL